jgi:2-methylisocitrate lyase-like PEP mutase family enzyme
MPNCFAFSSAALAATLAASRDSVGRLFVADILMDVAQLCSMDSSGVDVDYDSIFGSVDTVEAL